MPGRPTFTASVASVPPQDVRRARGPGEHVDERESGRATEKSLRTSPRGRNGGRA